MKCLENLSLVDDDCLEDLQEDIEELIESYINAKKLYLEIYRNKKEKLQLYQIYGLVRILTNVDSFWGEPICIHKDMDWEKEIRRFFNFNTKEDTEDSIISIVKMFQELSQDDEVEFDLQGDKRYWLFRDGANAEAHLMREELFLNFVEKILEFEDEKCVQIEILKYLKKL